MSDPTPTTPLPSVADATKAAIKATNKALSIDVRAIWPEAQDGLMLLQRNDTQQVRLIPQADWDGARKLELPQEVWDKLATPDLGEVIKKAQLTPDDLIYAFARSGIVSPATLTLERAKHAAQRLLHTISASAE